MCGFKLFVFVFPKKGGVVENGNTICGVEPTENDRTEEEQENSHQNSKAFIRFKFKDPFFIYLFN